VSDVRCRGSGFVCAVSGLGQQAVDMFMTKLF